MPVSSRRVLKRQGKVVLVETANPRLGVGYSVWNRDLGLWSGKNLDEAERQFEEATSNS